MFFGCIVMKIYLYGLYLIICFFGVLCTYIYTYYHWVRLIRMPIVYNMLVFMRMLFVVAFVVLLYKLVG